MKPDRTESSAVVQLDARSISELDDRAREPVDRIFDAGEQPVSVHPEVRVNSGTVVEMKKLMLSSSLDFNDSLLTQSSRARVGKLSGNGGMKRLCFRYCLSFHGFFQPLHCFFYLWQLGHFPSEETEKDTCAKYTML